MNSCVIGKCMFEYVGSTTWTNGDGESYANGDMMVHQYDPTTATVDFEFSAPQSSSGTLSEMAIAFKPSSPGASDSVRCLAAGGKRADLEQVSALRGAD